MTMTVTVEFEYFGHKERLDRLFSLEQIRLRRDLIMTHKIKRGIDRIDCHRLFAKIGKDLMGT